MCPCSTYFGLTVPELMLHYDQSVYYMSTPTLKVAYNSSLRREPISKKLEETTQVRRRCFLVATRTCTAANRQRDTNGVASRRVAVSGVDQEGFL